MRSTNSQEERGSIPDANSSIDDLWEAVLKHNRRKSRMTNVNGHYSIHFSQMSTHSSRTSTGWKWRGLEHHLQRSYNITLHMEPSCHILPEISVQYPSSDQIYIHKTDADCVSIAAQMMRMRQLEENESTLLGFLNSNLLPWPLVHRNAKLRRIQEKPILQASILDEPPVNLNVQDSNERSLSWNLTPDTLFLYSATSGFESNDIEQLNNLGLSRDIIALNGEFKSASGSALEARLQMVCAGVLVLLQRSKIHKAAGSADRARSPSLAPLSHYCFSICSGDYEIWRLEYVDDKFHGWQEFCGSLVYCHGVREFINIWNRLIHQVTGSQWDSLLADIRQTTVVKANDTESWRKRLRPRKR